MKLKLIIFKPIIKGEYNEPDKIDFTGNYAIETMLIKVSEKFFGAKISRAIEDLLKTRIKED